LDFDLGEVAPYVTCDLSEVEMNVESDILPTLDLSEVPKNFDAFALVNWSQGAYIVNHCLPFGHIPGLTHVHKNYTPGKSSNQAAMMKRANAKRNRTW